MAVPGYELVFTRTVDGTEHQDIVQVHPIGTSGPGGHPVFADPSGVVRAEISDRGEIRMLATGGHQDLQSPTEVRPLP
ncbi:DUF6296 family protein [Kitasatospora azatica]|uniref:DUF6296 family protein n=1 Tax=Kitasatospora azatica TaxID=58347 RepID=UPI00055D84EA|nr:DUF6296 family protein [Kitasatospora azatica]